MKRLRDQQEKNCEKCGSKLIKCFIDNGFKGLIVKNPEGDRFLSNKKNTTVNPYICSNCGFAEWYAEEPERLI